MAEWPDLGASMRYRPEPMTMDMVNGQRCIENVYMALFELDALIERYAYGLELIQPPAPGKMAIRFLKRPWGGVEGRHPQVVQWYRSRNGRWLYTRLKLGEVLRKVKGYPVFAPVKDDVKTLLAEALALIRHREAVLAAATNFRRQMGSIHARNVGFAEDKGRQIKDWLPLLLERREALVERGKVGAAAADVGLPEDAVANPRKRPRVDAAGRTRGSVHEVRKRR